MLDNKKIKGGNKLVLKKGKSALFSEMFEGVISSLSNLIYCDQNEEEESTITASCDYEIIFRAKEQST